MPNEAGTYPHWMNLLSPSKRFGPAPRTPIDDRRGLGRARAALIPALLLVLSLAIAPSSADAAGCDTCSADGQRACCAWPIDGDGLDACNTCDGGLLTVFADTGTCSLHNCYDTEACGADGERSCCQPPLENVGVACDGNLGEFTPCNLGFENCLCSEVLGVAVESSGVCRPVICGSEGERACCALGTDRSIIPTAGKPCHDGLIEVEAPNSGQCSGALVGALQSNGICMDPECGAEGERACCLNEQIAMGVPNCADGLIEVVGYKSENGDGACIGPLAVGDSSGTCHRHTPCGGAGQRACCITESILPCDDGQFALPGCSGDCFCGGAEFNVVDATLGISTNSCVTSTAMLEPTIGFTPPPPAAECSLRGYADLHMHLFADIAHGGGILAGSPCPASSANYCPEVYSQSGQLQPGDCSNTYCDETFQADANDALSDCYGSNRTLVNKDGDPQPNPQEVLTPHCPSHIPTCGTSLMHGDHTVFDDAVGSSLGTLDGSMSNLGAPAFNGWPQWSTTTHQQVYYKWLERAWRGGLRLMVQMAVNNTALCRTNKRIAGVDCEDTMAPIDQQLQAAYDFEQFVDLEVGGGIDTDSGWFRIVLTPGQARAEIAAGNMAVVLGVEVDNLFNCKFPSAECTINDHVIESVESCAFSLDNNQCGDPSDPSKTSEQWINDQVDHYYDTWGVRHMFPIHNFDNSFGGAATWQDAIEVGNRFVEGHWYKTQDCHDDGYRFKLGSSTTTIAPIFGFGEITVGEYPERDEEASCNAFGLFPLGEALVTKMMQRGMIVDIDHMSNESLSDTIAVAQAFRVGGYPLMASHALFLSLNKQGVRHERMRTSAQLSAMDAMGGMLGVMLKDDVLDRDTRGERKTLDYASSGIVDDCRHSSKTFAQGYLYGVDRMSGRAAMGSDFNGVAGHFGPRFGSDACGGAAGDLLFNADIQAERSQQLKDKNRLVYPFTLDEFGAFAKQVSGQKVFDYNVDGMAHVGLLPDFVADVKKIGVSNADIDPLLRSAERYIQMWELARGDRVLDSEFDGCEDCSLTDQTAPVLGCPTGPTVECTGAVTSASFPQPTVSEECTTASTPSCAPSSGSGFALGETTVECSSTDDTGNTGLCSVAVTVVDTVNPTAHCTSIEIELDGSGAATIVATDIDAGAIDTCSAVTLAADPTAFACSDIGANNVVLTASDTTGNFHSCNATVTVDDTISPSAVCQPTSLEVGTSGAASIAVGDVDGGSSDTCGVALSANETAFACADLGPNTVALTATDPSGNIDSCDAVVTVVDTVDPVALCQPTTVELSSSGVGSLVASDVDGGSSDGCGLTRSIDQDAFHCSDLGDNQVTLTITDPSGNTDECMATVTVSDNAQASLCCAGGPQPVCRDANPQRSKLHIRSKGSFNWKWKLGESSALADFKDPPAGASSYAICVYDQTGVLMDMQIPSGPKWKLTTRDAGRFKFRDRSATPDGILRMDLKGSDNSVGPRIRAKRRGGNLSAPPLPAQLPLTVQFRAGDGNGVECWEATFSEAGSNNGVRIRAKSD